MRVSVEQEYTRDEGSHIEILRFPETAPLNGSRMTIWPGGRSIVDRHEPSEIWFIASGKGTLTLNGVSSAVEAPEVISIEPWQDHQIINTCRDPLVIHSIWWKIAK